ncbi:TIM barrel protein [Proteocatella sphenisci]|uniref:TIM barrel protein n=1 Tax=Proteocatella sphenisci TaxID=181070 RepID=UPI00048BA868|nr:TIM barrel protein [Proteocatella sphenisci]
MKKLMHILKHEHTLDQYQSSDDLVYVLNKYNFDGFEIICCGDENSNKIPEDKITGYHMSFYSYWIDMWNYNPKRLILEYGDLETCMEFYQMDYSEFECADNRQEYIRHKMVDSFRNDCDHADLLGASYVVFHVSNVNSKETFNYELENENKVIIDAAAEIINQILDGRSYDFEFLLENLWWSGLDFLDPEDTVHLFDLVNYEKKGFMLDIGHLLNSNPNLGDEKEALIYINEVIERYDGKFDIKKHIRGIHLHQSLTGKYVLDFLKNFPDEIYGMSYYEKFAKLYDHVLQIDTHSPMVFDGTRDFINMIDPEYLVYEITESNRSQLMQLLDLQDSIFV